VPDPGERPAEPETVDLVEMLRLDDPQVLLARLSHLAPCCKRSVAVHLHERIVGLIAEKCGGLAWPESRREAIVAQAAEILGCSAEALARDVFVADLQAEDAAETEELDSMYGRSPDE